MTEAQAKTIEWMGRHRDVTRLENVEVVSLRGPGWPFAIVFPDGSYCAARTGDIHEAAMSFRIEGPS